MRSSTLVALASAIALVATMTACGDNGGEGTTALSGGGLDGGLDAGGDGDGDGDGDGNGDGDGAGDGDGDGDDDSGDGPLFDVGGGGSGDAGDGGIDDGCTKIDFLFVIDNSQSMEAEQQNLINSFAGFVSAIQNTTNAQDYHIMVADPDWDQSLWSCVKKCDTTGDALCKWDNSIVCADFLQPGDYSCDMSIGKGLTTGKTGASCNVAGGQPYIQEGQTDLEQTFSCLADVGIGGDPTEHVMDSMRFAVSDTFNQPGGCHPGFLRDDAILVVTFITDENPVFNVGGPAEWKQTLVDAKGGNEDAVVVLGLLGDTNLPNAVCGPKNGEMGAEDTASLRQFVDLFGARGSWGSVCAPDYSQFFADAVSVIDVTCDEFVPAG